MKQKNSSDKTYKKIQNYIINLSDLLGEGNFSKVYRAHHQITKQIVAIKIIELSKLKNSKLQQLLFSQIDILKQLNHPNVLKCYQAFTSDRNCYIVSELCNQGDLQTKLRTMKCMKQYQAQPYIRDIFKALIYLNNHSIVHRDIKIANIFLHNGTAKIADFGFAKFTTSKFKDINIGSPIYMSPEGLINRIYGPKTDIWAFGILVYQLLHGETPYSHSLSQKDLKRNVSIPITTRQLKQQLSNGIKEVIMKCLQVDEEARVSALQLSQLNYFIRNDSFTPINHNCYHFNRSNYANMVHARSNYLKGQAKYQINMSLQQNTSAYSQKQLQPYYAEKSSPHILKNTQTTVKYLPFDHQIYRPQPKYSIQTKNITLNSPLKIVLRKTQSFQPNQILSVSINFKQCVNILHYCRLLFKHLVLMKQVKLGNQKQLLMTKDWLFLILRAIYHQAQQKRVQSQGHNHQERQAKLQEVINQYMQKYAKQIHINKQQISQNTSPNYGQIYNYFLSTFQTIDQLVQRYSINKQLLYLGHSIVIICNYTKIMKSCFQQLNYTKLQKIGEVQEFLSMSKDQLDMPSYQWYKKKNWMAIIVN